MEAAPGLVTNERNDQFDKKTSRYELYTWYVHRSIGLCLYHSPTTKHIALIVTQTPLQSYFKDATFHLTCQVCVPSLHAGHGNDN